jgi:hypothetical protein
LPAYQALRPAWALMVGPPMVPLLVLLPALMFAQLPAAEWALPALEPAPSRALLPPNSGLSLGAACL